MCEAIHRAERGLIDADLGAGIVKQRIARRNEGKSGGFRSLVLFRGGDRAFFVFGFPKNSRDNIESDELEGFRELAKTLLHLNEEQLRAALDANIFEEVMCHEQNLSQ